MPFISSVRGSYGPLGKRKAQRANYPGLGSTGGTIVTAGGYRYHTFTSVGTSTFTPDLPGTVEVLIIGGGGGGGGGWNFTGPGGGGAGSVLYGTPFIGSATTVVVGAGGAGGTNNGQNYGGNGGNSSFGSFIANGGGAGGNGKNWDCCVGAAGGSGGGGSNGGSSSSSHDNPYVNNAVNAGLSGGAVNQTVYAGFTSYGSAGGPGAFDNPYNVHGGGGGGGAGGAGSVTRTAFHLRAGDGGVGTNAFSTWASATSTGVGGYYAGGGGGGTYQWTGDQTTPVSNWASEYPNYIGRGGLGGGGNGGVGSGILNPTAATANTGSGGGGGGYQLNGTAGGSGLVIVRYPI